MSAQTVTPRDLYGRMNASPKPSLIDVRTPAEFREIHADGARLAPLDALDPKQLAAELAISVDRPIYLICKSGQRAAKAADKMLAAGVQSVFVVEGGTAAWESAGLPVVRGKKTISLERQVRIAAGLLVVAGVVLGWFVNRYFLGLSAFVGAGLVFSGITDTCGMGMMLAKMPWNQVNDGGSGGASCSK